MCESRKQPAAHRPGALPRDLGFNTTIGLDTVEFNEGSFKKILLNIICWGTGYQMICVVPDKSAKSAKEGYAKHWVRYFGHPELVITDQGTEFTGATFTQYVAEGGTLQHLIDSQSPWQN